MCDQRVYRFPSTLSNSSGSSDLSKLEKFLVDRNKELEIEKVMNRLERIRNDTDSDAVDRELRHVISILDDVKFYINSRVGGSL